MATTKESNLSNLYIELNRFGQNGEYERALKTANKSKSKYIRNYNTVTTSKMCAKYAPYVEAPCMRMVTCYCVLQCEAIKSMKY